MRYGVIGRAMILAQAKLIDYFRFSDTAVSELVAKSYCLNYSAFIAFPLIVVFALILR